MSASASCSAEFYRNRLIHFAWANTGNFSFFTKHTKQILSSRVHVTNERNSTTKCSEHVFWGISMVTSHVCGSKFPKTEILRVRVWRSGSMIFFVWGGQVERQRCEYRGAEGVRFGEGVSPQLERGLGRWLTHD